MRILVVYSTLDPAGVNIFQKLTANWDLEEVSLNPEGFPVYMRRNIFITATEMDLVYASHVEGWMDTELIVFISRHRSLSGMPCLTVHTPGNLTEEADMGGIPRRICISPAPIIKRVLRTLYRSAQDSGLLGRYQVTLEATHHGDYLDRTPCLFVEIGSGEEEWKDHEAAEVVAEALVTALESVDLNVYNRYTTSAGLGGPHYSVKMTNVVLNTDVAIGHIASKYTLPVLDIEMIIQLAKRTLPQPDFFILDRKGLGPEKGRVLALIEEEGYRWKNARDIL